MRRLIAVALAFLSSIPLFSQLQTSTTQRIAPGQSGLKPLGNGTPNILFIIMDDVGIDQMRIFGYGGLTHNSAPNTPNIDVIARAGVRFRNTWAMPECSPSRVIFFQGRYPLRTNVYNAILSTDLANSQLSPYELTTPEVLRTVGYTSALFGKFHLAGPDFNPYTYGTPHIAGFDYFDGFLEGAPYPIDTTIGGQFPINSTSGSGPFSCGFIPAAKDGGADFGACHFVDNTCVEISRDKDHPAPGKSCLEQGGLFVPKLSCNAPPPRPLNFNLTNAYYIWKRVINEPDGTVIQYKLTDPTSRHYVSDSTTQSAVDWINMENAGQKPWMATVSYANIHTPYQQPPSYLLPAREIDGSGLACTGNAPQNTAALRIISNQMLEAMDTEIGRVMVQTGLATYNADGSLNYHPEKTNTMIVIVGDNGTYAPSVKPPFDSSHAKGTVYQTGVWVPLIVAGPLVVSPDREVSAMINIADLFQLFGEIGGVDVHQVDPHIIDSVSMLPYITNPQQAEIRQVNFTQTQSNIHLDDEAPPPCVINLTSPPTCVQIFTSQQLCAFEGGTWYGPGGTPQFQTCCDVKNALYKDTDLTLLADSQMAARNDSYKLISNQVPNCSTGGDDAVTEFYQIDEKPINPEIDLPANALCANDVTGKQPCPGPLNDEQRQNFNALQTQMTNILASQPPCPGDGNEDLLVNNLDLTDWQFFSISRNSSGQTPSWYDFNHDGKTDADDEAVIQQYLGTNCRQQQPGKPVSALRKP
jgi:arylsulfatase A-like enzyme